MNTKPNTLLLAVLLAAVSNSYAMADELPPNDPVFQALGDELARSMTLELEDLDKPYFIQFAVDDEETHRISATYGALLSSDGSRTRAFSSQIRVGSHALDNTNFSGGDFGGRRGGGRRRSGGGGFTLLPVDDDPIALRQAIWRAVDSQYKQAVETLTQKRAYLEDRNVEDRPQDFTRAKAITSNEPKVSLKLDQSEREGYVRNISAQFLKYKHIQNSRVTLAASAENRYLVNSEGSRLRTGKSEVSLEITAEGRTDDGERLSDRLSYFAESADQLPTLDRVLADVTKLAEQLATTRKASVLEDYEGPVLFDDIAAAQIFQQLVAGGVTGRATPVGTQRRRGRGSDDLESRLGKRLLPSGLHVYDDPTRKQFEDTLLAGHYLIDDEGVPAQRVDIVVDGKLTAMALSRTPTKQFSQSNGHGRRGRGSQPRAAVGCLYVEAEDGQSAADLKKALIEAADDQGLEYGLRISAIRAGGSADLVARFRRGGGRPASNAPGDPIAIHKIYVADGREEPVRGCEFGAIDTRSLRDIIAVGSERTVYNTVGRGAPPSSIIAPAVLFEELELLRIEQESEKGPIVEAPHARK